MDSSSSAYEPIDENSDDRDQNDLEDVTADHVSSYGVDREELETEIQRYKPTSAQIKEYSALISTLDYSHRTNLTTHLASSYHLSSPATLFRPVWTSWPLPASLVPRSKFQQGGYNEEHIFDSAFADSDVRHAEDSDDEEASSLGKQPYLSEIYDPPKYGRPLLCEITAHATKLLAHLPSSCFSYASGGDIVENSRKADFLPHLLASSPAEIEEVLLYPHLHAYVLAILDNVLDGLKAMRESHAPRLARHRLKPLDWTDVLGVAALCGSPCDLSLEEENSAGFWENVIKDTRSKCRGLFDRDIRLNTDIVGAVSEDRYCNSVEQEFAELSRSRGWDPASEIPRVSKRKSSCLTKSAAGQKRRAIYEDILKKRQRKSVGAGEANDDGNETSPPIDHTKYDYDNDDEGDSDEEHENTSVDIYYDASNDSYDDSL